MKRPEVHYAILGDGRLARHMRHYLELEGYTTSAWARNAQSPFNSDSQADAEQRLRNTLGGADRVLMLVADDALAPLLRQYPFLHQHRLLHCAGALSIPGVIGAHPLMTFGNTLYAAEDYQAIPFMVEEGHDFVELFPGLPNPSYAIATEHKALYHALCVMAGNFPQLLWQTVGTRLQGELGVPSQALGAYLQRSLDNFLDDPDGALTGPLARHDHATLNRNITALGASPLAGLFESFVAFYQETGRQPQERHAS